MSDSVKTPRARALAALGISIALSWGLSLPAPAAPPGPGRGPGPAEAAADGGAAEQAAAEGAAPAPGPARRLPWSRTRELRYRWLRDGEAVGETSFRVERVPDGEREAYAITSRRTYDHTGTSQRSEAATIVGPDGAPRSFRETLHLVTLKGARSKQETRIDIEGKSARAVWIHNDRSAQPLEREFEIPPGTFLCGSQALEHWAVFTATFPPAFEKHAVQLFYPDLKQVLDVEFSLRGTETIRIGGEEVKARHVSFAEREGRMEGKLWLDGEGSILQIEFPKSSLRVVLAKTE